MLRKALIFFALFCVVASTAWAGEVYDETKRTERLGLSYYDGRPLYIAELGSNVTALSGITSAENILSCRLVRASSELEITDVLNGSYTSDAHPGIYKKTVNQNGEFYCLYYGFFCVSDDGQLDLLSGSVRFPSAVQNALASAYARNMLAEETGVEVYDGMGGVFKRWFPVALGFGLAFFSIKSFRRYLFQFLTSSASNGGNFESAFNSMRNDARLDRDIRKKSKELAQRVEAYSTAEAVIDDLTSGKAYGVEFSAKLVDSNRKLQNAWKRLTAEERQMLLDELGEKMKSTKDASKRLAQYRRESVDLAFSGIEGYGDAFADDDADDEDDEKKTPF